MNKDKDNPLGLPTFDELFMDQESRDDLKREKVQDVSLDLIDPFPDHPFQVKLDEAMDNMVDSVREYGVLSPVLVRPKEEGRFELVSGHRRKQAAELARLETLPAIVRDMTRDEAVIAMVDANLQRENILPSEKAHSYKMKLEAIKRQAGRPSKNSVPTAQNYEGKTSRQVIAEQSGESQDQIRRYIRLTELIPDILQFVDTKELGMRQAVELSYLSTKEQALVFEAMECEVCMPSHAQAIKMRKFAEDGKLSTDVITSIMVEEKPNQVEQVKIRSEKISKFFKPGTSKEDMEARIIKGLELLDRAERKRDRER